jgi:hypothetical protein
VAVNERMHKAVVVISNAQSTQSFGFPHIYSAVAFIERQIEKPAFAFEKVQGAISDGGVEIEGSNYQILDTDTYLDLFTTGDESSSDED